MLSRLSSMPKAGRCIYSAFLMSSRPSSSAVVATRPRDKVVEDWENFKMPLGPYEGMGPLPPKPEWDPKCMRHYIIPEYWFDFLYPRIGVTGPYTLALGTTAFLLSKEWYVYTPETLTTICLVTAIYILLKKVGPQMRAEVNNMEESQYDTMYSIKMGEIEHIEAQIEDIKTEQWRSGLQDLYHDVKKSNLAVMLETEFLSRKASFVAAIKKKLDYQVSVQEVDRGLAHAHMVNWIEEKVRKSLTPESQKKTLDVCIAQLGAMTTK